MVKKLILFLVLVSALVVAVVMTSPPKVYGPEQKITPQAATGSVNDLAASLLSEISDEQLNLDQAAQDGDLLFSDSQEISDLNQSVDANEF